MKRKIIIIVLISIFIKVDNSSAQIAAFSAAMSAKSIISDLQKGIQDVIQRADVVVSSQQFQLRNNLIVLNDNLAHRAEKFRDETFEKLDAQEKSFFENLRTTINESNRNANLLFDRVDLMISQLEGAIVRLPFAKTFPIVYNYTPSTILSSETIKRISVLGSFIGYKTPILKISNGVCNLESKTERNLVFGCQGLQFATTNCIGSYPLKGSLTIFNKRTFWQIITSLFSDRNKKSYDYKVALYPITNVAATYTISVTNETIERENNPRKESRFEENEHCAPNKPFSWQFTASSGWKIDVATIDESDHGARRECIYNGVRNATEVGFSIDGVLVNDGTCGPFWTDARGAANVNVKFTEYREVKKETQVNNIQSGQVYWGSSSNPINLPPTTKNYTVTLTKCDGTTSVLSGIQSDGWFELSRSGNSLIIKCNKVNF